MNLQMPIKHIFMREITPEEIKLYIRPGHKMIKPKFWNWPVAEILLLGAWEE